VNMGPDINTAGDEMFPYVRADGTLYFSSDSHVGYGGLDIYKAEPKEIATGMIWEITNLGPGINTFADDFGIAFKGTLQEGLLSSSRGSSRAVDNIFSFELPKIEFTLEGSVLNNKTGKPIPGAYVRLIGTDGTNTKLSIQEDGKFSMQLKPAAEYVLLIAAKGFFNHKEKFSTFNEAESKVYQFDIDMLPTETAIMLRNIYFDENSYKLPEGAKTELDRLLRILLDNPSMKIEIGGHADDKGDDNVNITLSQKRAEAVMNYLVSKGVPKENLTTKGYGRSKPLKVDRNLASDYRFLRDGDILSPELIKQFKRNSQAQAHKLNRRIEFKIVDKE